MDPNQRALVDRNQAETFRGYRVLAGGEPDPAWTIERATGDIRLTRKASVVTLEAGARLRVHTSRAVDWIALEVPEAVPDMLDFGTANFTPDWTLGAVTDESGAPLEVVVPDVEPGAVLAFRPDRRLVLVRWPTPLPADTTRTLEVRWQQLLPYGRPELMASEIYASGAATPLLTALPRLAADGTPFPYTLTTWAPDGMAVAASGVETATLTGPQGTGTRTVGRVGGEAVVAAGRWAAAQLGDVAVFAEGATREMADAVAKVARPLDLWSGVRIGETRFVSLPRTWRPPAALGGEGMAGFRRAVDPGEARLKKKGGPPPNLPEYATVLGAEGLASSAWTGRGGASAAGRAWLWAFGRAFALDVLQPKDAAPWREWLQTCARPREGMRPAFSPEAAATGTWREISMRCAGPMIVGPMMDDRLGADVARLVRREVLSGPQVDFAALRAAVVARDASAAGWADRWLGGGNPVRLRVGWSATPGVGGTHVHGVVESDSDLAGAPVQVRLRRGRLVQDVTVLGDGERVPIDVDVPFVPTRVEVDPERRMLRDPLVEGGADPP